MEDRLVYFAKKHLGKPYKYGAKPYEAPGAFDCSSFVQYLYKMIGITLPRTAIEQATLGKKVPPSAKNLKIGDLIFVKGSWGRYNPEFPDGIGHVAIYVGGGKVIEAKWDKRGGSVVETLLTSYLKRKDLRIIKRIF